MSKYQASVQNGENRPQLSIFSTLSFPASRMAAHEEMSMEAGTKISGKSTHDLSLASLLLNILVSWCLLSHETRMFAIQKPTSFLVIYLVFPYEDLIQLT